MTPVRVRRPQQLQLFPQCRRSPTHRMHVMDAGDDEAGELIARFECNRCGATTGWEAVRNVAEGRRGLPCPTCNKTAGGDR